MSPARLAGLVRALGGVDWTSLKDKPALTLLDVAEALAPAFGVEGVVAVDGIELFILLNKLGLIKPGSPREGQTHDTPHTGRRS